MRDGLSYHIDAYIDFASPNIRRYLSREHKLPLGRMSTISYGDTLPVESNKTAKGRAKNRRVVIVVLE